MKIVYILNSTDVYGGATKSFTALLYALLQKYNITPLVVLPDSNGIQKELSDKGIKTLVLNYRHNIYPSLSSFKDCLLWIPRLVYWRYLNAIAVRRLSKHIKGYDLIHTNVSVIDIGQRSAKQNNIPHVFHFREYANLDFNMHYYPCRKRFLASVSYSICITHGIRNYNRLQSSTASRVIYNPIDTDKERNPAAPHGDYFLYAGRLEKTKGVEDLLHAYSKASLHTPLLVAGSFLQSDYRQTVLSLTKQLGIEKNVQFLGNRNDIFSLMSNAKVLVVPSHFEGFGRSMAEAMAHECIVIGRDMAGIKEQFDNGKDYTGKEIGFRFSSVSELTEILQTVDQMPEEELNMIRKRAYETVNHLYSVAFSARQTYDFYKFILNNK